MHSACRETAGNRAPPAWTLKHNLHFPIGNKTFSLLQATHSPNLAARLPHGHKPRDHQRFPLAKTQ